MRGTLFSKAFLVGVCLFFAWRGYASDGVWTNARSGAWSDVSKWVGGAVAGEGGTATFKAASGTFSVTNDAASPVVLSGLSANTDAGQTAAWAVVGGTNEMVAPALIHTRSDSLSVRAGTLSGGADLLITGFGRFFLGDDNLYTGRTIISNGNVRVARDSGFGPVPASPVADAIILDNGGLENDDNNFVLTNHVNRGITVTSRGGFIGCGYTSAGFVINSPVTGPGLLGINFENCPVTLNNPANDFAGGTVVGTNGPGANTACLPTLRLGQNEVLPHGVGKGGLSLGADSSFNNTLPVSTLDLNGRTETVNTLVSGPRSKITSSVFGQGRLVVGAAGDDSDFRGSLEGGATLEKQGSGSLHLSGATLAKGSVHLKGGTVFAGGPNLGAGATVIFDGGDLRLTAPSGFYEYFGAGGAVLDLGAPLTFSGWRLFPEKGAETVAATFVSGRQYVYRARWRLPQAGVYSFAKGFDDSGYLAIDGVPLLSNTVTATRAVVNDVALDAGWHTLELRVGDGSGGVGPQFGFRNGILFDPQNGGFTNAAELARARVLTDDGGTNLVAYGRDCAVAARLFLARDAELSAEAAAGRLVFAGNLTTNAAADPEPVLTVSSGGEPLLFGSDNGTPAVLDAAVSCADGLVFTNRVWLRRLPAGGYAIAAGSDLALDGDGLLGGPLTLDSYSVRVVRGDSVGGDGSVTANAGTAVWFDSMRYVDHALVDSSATACSFANSVALNGGGARFTGAGNITYSGALTGAGNAVKTGAGDLLLTGAGSSLAGEIQVQGGRLLPANEEALGGATVRLSGGRLSHPAGADLTLDTTPVVAVSGGFDVAGGRTLTLNGALRGEGAVSKWGDGTLVLGGLAANTNFDLVARAGAVQLNKDGGAGESAVRQLTVATNVTVALTGSSGNQIGGGVVLDGGVLDLNGRSESVGALTNTAAGGTVTNGGATASVLTVGEGGASSAFSGLFTDGAASLGLAKTGAGSFALPSSSLAGFSGGTAVKEGTLRLSFGLPVTAGLAYRLDATDAAGLTLVDGTNVSAWADSSAGGFSFGSPAVSNQPVFVKYAINGLPAVRFGYGGSKRLLANKIATNRTVFIVARVVAQQSLAGIWGQSGQDSGIRQNNATSWRHTGNGADNNDFSKDGEMYIDGVSGFSFAASPLHLLSAVSAANKVWTTALGDYWGHATYNRYFKGDIGEVLAYDRVLSISERQKVEAYLKAKWLGGQTLPASRPVAVEPGALLAVQGVNLTFGALSGGGALSPESGNTLTLADCGSFTGVVAGVGTVAVRGATGEAVAFVPQSLGVTVRNDGAQPAVVRVGTQETGVFYGSVQDGSNALGVVHAGPGTTYFGGTNSTYTGVTAVSNGAAIVGGAVSAQYVRFFPEAMRTNGDHTGTGYQISEFQLTLNGGAVAFPAGTLASCPGSGWSVSESPQQAIDGDVNTKFYINSASPVLPLVVALPAPAVFDGVRWYTANDAQGRDPVAWHVDISADGVNWTQVDRQDYFDRQSEITWSRKALAGLWPLYNFSDMNVFSDRSVTTVSASGTLGVSRTSETVGPLGGDGAVSLIGGGVLGINAFADAAFSGSFCGTGTVVKTGAATQALSGMLAFSGELVVDEGTLDLGGATLSGVTGIVIRAGATLTGTATVLGDVTVRFEGGSYSGSLAVSGELTVRGEVRLAVPAGATYPYRATLFSYALADEGTLAALENAVMPVAIPSGFAASLRVSDTMAQLVVSPLGCVLFVR